MKIGFVFDDSLDKSDGVQQYILTLGHWLHGQGHEIHYLVGQTERTDLAHVHSLSRNLQVHFNQNRMSTPLPANKRAIKALLSAQAFDVLHVQMPYSPFMAGRVIRAAPKGTAIVGTFHIIPFSWLERIATTTLGLALRGTLRRFDTIYSVSKPASRFAQRSFAIQSQVLPNVVNISQFQQGHPIKKYQDGKINIVFLGRLVERKGCMHLLQAVHELKQQHHLERVRVLICGKGPMLADLKQYVRTHHLSDAVHFVGYVSEHEKIDYLATADMAVLPSTGGESFGIVLIEAMAAGSRVVIGGDNKGYRSVLGQRTDQLVNPANTRAFAATLRHFIDNSRARNSAHRWQNEHVKQFDVRIVGAELVKAYKQAIAKKAITVDNKQ